MECERIAQFVLTAVNVTSLLHTITQTAPHLVTWSHGASLDFLLEIFTFRVVLRNHHARCSYFYPKYKKRRITQLSHVSWSWLRRWHSRSIHVFFNSAPHTCTLCTMLYFLKCFVYVYHLQTSDQLRLWWRTLVIKSCSLKSKSVIHLVCFQIVYQ